MEKERGAAAAVNLSNEEIYKIELPANRYDLLCVEGLTRALRIFKGYGFLNLLKPSCPVMKAFFFIVIKFLKTLNFSEKEPHYQLEKPSVLERITVKKTVSASPLFHRINFLVGCSTRFEFSST